jgi:HD-GYP domain-containing protein (c-di-GMP phosphodiesterase class II)
MARSPFTGTSVPFRLYYAAVVLLGVALAVACFPGVRPVSWVPLVWWVLFVVAADVSAIKLPGGRAYIAVSSSLDYAAIALFGPAAAALIAVLSTSITQIAIHRRPPHRVLFNICLFIVTIMVSGYAYRVFGGESAKSLGALMLPLGVCGLVYFSVNTGAVSLVIALSQNENAWRVWQSTYAWTLTHLVAFVPLGALIVVVYNVVGLPGVALFLLPLLLARYTFKLYTDMRQEHLDTVRALTSAIDASDPFTRGHSERVTEYAVAIARELGLSEQRVMTIEYASLIHDMGKISLQHSILLKPGKLTDEEWERMKTHPETGARIVSDLRFLRGAKDVVLHHHERFDGLGYPHGLAGSEIPLEARIVKVADAFDAMMSDRPYRPSLGTDAAISELERGKGSEFDPSVVDAFVRLLRERRVAIHSSAADPKSSLGDATP